MIKHQIKLIFVASLMVSGCQLDAAIPEPAPDLLEDIPPAVPVPMVMGTSLDKIDAVPAPATSDVGDEGKPEIRPEPTELMGKEIGWVEQKFGSPDFLRWEKKIRIMQYHSSSCVMDMFFYEEGADRSLILKHFDARDRVGATIAPRPCIATLLPNHQWARGIDITPKN
jgi:hypothetical protein